MKQPLIIDAHSHLWLHQDTTWNGQAIRSKRNGRADFLSEEVQMIPPFLVDGRNTAEAFLSNMDYAQVSAAIVVQELIDGCQNDYLEEVHRRYPERFIICGLCDYLSEDNDPQRLANEATELSRRGFQGIAIPGHRLLLDNRRIRLNSPQMMQLFHTLEEKDLFLSITLADGDTQVAEMEEVIAECPRMRIAVGHFGMPTRQGWLEQIRLARHQQVFVEAGGITWLYHREFYPYPSAVRAILEAADQVGMDKLMWGSDYPRTITAITYRMSYDFILKSDAMTEAEKALFLGENARRFYRLNNVIELPYIKNMSE